MKLISLEFFRALTSIYVFILHYGRMYMKSIPEFLIVFLLFGPEAVTIFFIISGFVINYSFENKHQSTKEYYIKRFRRIYPIYILSILVSLLSIYLQHMEMPEISQILGHLFMLQSIPEFAGTLFLTFKSNPPLWTLAHEWWYYVLFIPFIFLASKLKRSAYLVSFWVCIFCTIVYFVSPNFFCLIGMYLFIWFTGVEFSKLYRKNPDFGIKESYYIPLMLFVVVAVTACCILFLYTDALSSWRLFPLLVIRYPLAAFAISLIVIFLKKYNVLLEKIIPHKAILALSSISYGIYIFHYPIITLPDYAGITFLDILWKTALIFALSYVAEIKLQPVINNVIRYNKK